MNGRRRLLVACAVLFVCLLGVRPASAWWIFGGRDRDYTRTRYPIVLVPGVGGFGTMFGSFDYFLGLPDALRDDGAQVYVVELAALGSLEERGEVLLSKLRYIAAVSGAPKLNVIAHSQGGLDARYVLAVRPDLFASLTTVGSAHTGAPLADFLLENTDEKGFTRTVGLALADATGFLVNLLAGSPMPQDAGGALRTSSTAFMAEFNARYPFGLPSTACGDGPSSWRDVRLYSWSGTAPFTNPLDPSDYFFGLAAAVTGGESDGLVPRCASHFGDVLRDDYRLNHGDEINQVFGLANVFATSPSSIFRTHANRLRNEGL